MAGLVPAIHAAPFRRSLANGPASRHSTGVDARDKRGHDGGKT